MRTFVLVLALLVPLTAVGQIVPEREVEVARQLYDNGKYAEALKRADSAMQLSNFTDAQRLLLHEVAGLSAFNLGDQKAAATHFRQVLLLDPDHQLDPFAVAPPALKLFEQVRHDNADEIGLVRQQQLLRAEQLKRERAEHERVAKEEEERRRRIEELTRAVTIRTVEKRSMLMNFVPFGAGQFQQNRVGWGVTFAVSQAVFAITSIISYLAINALYEPYTITLTDRYPAGSTYSVTINRIPASRHTDYMVWSGLKYSTGIAFFASWLLGIGDALWHHQAEVVTETREQLGPRAEEPVRTQLNLFPTQGGLGAGLTVHF